MNPVPATPRRIVLVNPTRYLGNLLLAGGLIQDYAAQCQQQDRELRVVIDAAYRDLLQGTLPDDMFIWYPRREMAQATSAWQKLKLYWRCLSAIRAFDADLAFNIEEDSVSHRLTQWSGARFKLGCSTNRHKSGYDHVLAIDYSKRPESRRHRWYSFLAVFTALGLPEPKPHYLQFPSRALPDALRSKLQKLGLDMQHGFVVLHAGATKDYKLWPLANFAALTQKLIEAGHQVAFIGSGKDADNTAAILQLLPAEVPRQRLINCCNQLTLAELVDFFRLATFVIGNDSGPFHLASATGAPGAVIFGPTDKMLWGPLSDKAVVMQNENSNEVCDPQCTKTGCIYQHRCLTAITPDRVLAAVPTVSRTS